MFGASLARRVTACRKRRLPGVFCTCDGASSPPGGLEGWCAEYDRAGWYPKGSQPLLLDRAWASLAIIECYHPNKRVPKNTHNSGASCTSTSLFRRTERISSQSYNGALQHILVASNPLFLEKLPVLIGKTLSGCWQGLIAHM